MFFFFFFFVFFLFFPIHSVLLPVFNAKLIAQLSSLPCGGCNQPCARSDTRGGVHYEAAYIQYVAKDYIFS